MFKDFQKCVISESHQITGNVKLNVTLPKLDKFIGQVIITGKLGKKGVL